MTLTITTVMCVACRFDVRGCCGSSDGTKLQFAVVAVTVVAVGDVDDNDTECVSRVGLKFGDAVVAVTAEVVVCGCRNGGCSRQRGCVRSNGGCSTRR